MKLSSLFWRVTKKVVRKSLERDGSLRILEAVADSDQIAVTGIKSGAACACEVIPGQAVAMAALRPDRQETFGGRVYDDRKFQIPARSALAGGRRVFEQTVRLKGSLSASPVQALPSAKPVAHRTACTSAPTTARRCAQVLC
jgi:hypothetical protein